MVKSFLIASLAAIAFRVPFASANSPTRDTNNYNYYSNPNVAYSHYWAEAKNVYQDLSTFKKLYVKYHNCAWSTTSYKFGGGGGDDDSVSGGCAQNNNNNNNNYNNNGNKFRFLEDGGDLMNCGNKAGSCDQWWGGMQPCYGANVAYSLYGILPGDVYDHPCNKHTFINSFFTRDGLSSFVQASNGQIDMSSLSEVCSRYNDDYGTSTSCASDGTFTSNIYNGACVEGNYVSTADTLESLNDALSEDMQCALIYDGSKTDYATQLLSQSVQCSFDEESCPDPYGVVKKYEYNLLMASKDSSYKVPDVDAHARDKLICAFIFYAIGAALLVIRFKSICFRSREVEHPDLKQNLYSVSA